MVIDDMYAAAQRLKASEYVQLKIHCGAQVMMELHAAPYPSRFGFRDAPMLFGWPVELDKWIPPRVWRLTDPDDTLLYDCREGRRMGESAW